MSGNNYTISLDNLDKVCRLLEYLDKYPLFGVKYMNYEALNKAYYIQHSMVSKRGKKKKIKKG